MSKAPAVPRLHLIGPLDGMTLAAYIDLAVAVSARGCDAVHIRAQDAGSAELLRAIRDFRERQPHVTLIVNERVDLAILGNASGVQLGERALRPHDARTLCGEGMLIGRSIHDLRGAQRAEFDGADYLLAGHIYATPSKPGQPGRGCAWLETICRHVRIPVIALGGITVANIPEVLTAGANGVAMGREILRATAPIETARHARQQLEQSTRT